jgi:hypothetical protein
MKRCGACGESQKVQRSESRSRLLRLRKSWATVVASFLARLVAFPSLDDSELPSFTRPSIYNAVTLRGWEITASLRQSLSPTSHAATPVAVPVVNLSRLVLTVKHCHAQKFNATDINAQLINQDQTPQTKNTGRISDTGLRGVSWICSFAGANSATLRCHRVLVITKVHSLSRISKDLQCMFSASI